MGKSSKAPWRPHLGARNYVLPSCRDGSPLTLCAAVMPMLFYFGRHE
jgi:hypothetical protein